MTDTRTPALLLDIRDLRVAFATSRGAVTALDGVDLQLSRGETLAIVGESGSGKSTLALSLLRLVPSPPGQVSAQRLRFDDQDQDLLSITERAMRRLRGSEIAMIFQEPMSSLNPLVPVGVQIAEGLWTHQRMHRRQAKRVALEMMERVGIPRAAARFAEYPHNFSGGMQQRVMIASAIASQPRLLVADEPTTALDVTVQAQIIDLLAELRAQVGMAIILITHNIAIVPRLCDRLIVLYAGRVVEVGDTRTVLKHPVHPYTRSLLESVPRLDQDDAKPLFTLGGRPPSPGQAIPGCPFAPRCRFRQSLCESAPPTLRAVPTGQHVSCFMAEDLVQNTATP